MQSSLFRNLVINAGLALFMVTLSQSAFAQESPATVPVQKELQRHDGFMRSKQLLLETGGTSLVFIGDSITDAWRADPQREIYENYFGQYRPYNIGISGDETQNVLWRIQNGELDGIDPKLVVMMIGTNNIGNSHMSSEETAKGVQVLVSTIREKLPRAKILLLGIFPRAYRPDHPQRVAVVRANQLISQLGDDKTVIFKDLSAQFLDAGGFLPGSVMPDYLHPSIKGYEIWAKTIKPFVDALAK